MNVINTRDTYRAHIGVQAVLCAVILVFAVLTWVAIRRTHDAARKGMKWLYTAFALCFLAYLFSAVDYGLYLQPLRSGTSARARVLLAVPRQRVDQFEYLFRALTACAILPCIAGMAAGIYQHHNARVARISYTLVAALAIVTAILAVTVFSGRQWLLSESIRLAHDSRTSFDYRAYQRVTAVDKDMGTLYVVVEIMLLVISVMTVAWACVSVTGTRKVRKEAADLGMPHMSVGLLVAASMLNLVPRGFSMVQVGLALGQGMPSRIRYWWPLTNLILDRAITAAVLGLLFGYAYRTARSQLRTLKDKDGGIQHT